MLTEKPKGFDFRTTRVRHVVQWWVLAFALAKVGMALGDFVLAIMYFNQTLGPDRGRFPVEILRFRFV